MWSVSKNQLMEPQWSSRFPFEISGEIWGEGAQISSPHEGLEKKNGLPPPPSPLHEVEYAARRRGGSPPGCPGGRAERVVCGPTGLRDGGC